MAAEIRIPPLGESINEATLVRWLKEDGAHVEADEVVLELETEKAAMEVQAETSGRLRIVVRAGSQVTPGTVVGRITEEAAPARKDAAPETKQAPADKPRVAEPVGAARAAAPSPHHARSPHRTPSRRRGPSRRVGRSRRGRRLPRRTTATGGAPPRATRTPSASR